MRPEGDFERLDPPHQAIQDARPRERGPAAAPLEDGVTSAYGSCARNGRTRTPLGSTTGWEVAWRAPLEKGVADCILATRERIFVTGSFGRRLFSLQGAELARGWFVGGPPTIHPADQTLLVPEPSGGLQAYELEQGRPRFRTVPAGGELTQFVWRHERRLLSCASNVHLDAHDEEICDPSTVLEAIDLGDPLETDASLDLLSRVPLGELHIDRTDARAAPAPDGRRVLIAVRDRLVVVGPDLRPTGVFTGAFEPVALSVDEAGWFHLIVVAERERERHLWVVTPAGERVVARTLPAKLADAKAPPAIGLDHRVVVVGSRRVVCYGQDGEPRWEVIPLAPPAGWLITGDDRFLLADGPRVAVHGEQALERVLYVEAGERIVAGPCLTPRGALLVATAKELICFDRPG